MLCDVIPPLFHAYMHPCEYAGIIFGPKLSSWVRTIQMQSVAKSHLYAYDRTTSKPVRFIICAHSRICFRSSFGDFGGSQLGRVRVRKRSFSLLGGTGSESVCIVGRVTVCVRWKVEGRVGVTGDKSAVDAEAEVGADVVCESVGELRLV